MIRSREGQKTTKRAFQRVLGGGLRRYYTTGNGKKEKPKVVTVCCEGATVEHKINKQTIKVRKQPDEINGKGKVFHRFSLETLSQREISFGQQKLKENYHFW